MGGEEGSGGPGAVEVSEKRRDCASGGSRGEENVERCGGEWRWVGGGGGKFEGLERDSDGGTLRHVTSRR